MIQILVPLNRSETNKEIQLKYQLIWETQYNINNKGQFFLKSIEPNVKNIQIINLQKNICIGLLKIPTSSGKRD